MNIGLPKRTEIIIPDTAPLWSPPIQIPDRERKPMTPRWEPRKVAA
jgi:hypothetical protein